MNWFITPHLLDLPNAFTLGNSENMIITSNLIIYIGKIIIFQGENQNRRETRELGEDYQMFPLFVKHVLSLSNTPSKFMTAFGGLLGVQICSKMDFLKSLEVYFLDMS